MNVNDTSDQTTPDASTMRRVAADLVAEAPPAAPWGSVVARADGVEPVGAANTSKSTNRPLLLAVATFAALALGVGTLAVRGSGSSTLVPADATTTPDSEVESIVSSTEPVGSTTSVPSAPSPTSTVRDTQPEPDVMTPPDLDAIDPLAESADAAPVVELTTTPVTEITRLPDRAWVAPGVQPAGFRPLYAVDDGVGRRVVYRDEAGTDLTISTDPVAIAGGDAVEIGGQTWLSSTSTDGFVSFQLDVSQTVVEVSARGLDLETARPIIESLVAGGDAVLPLEPLRPSADYREHDLLAEDSSDASTTMRGFGIGGWYCLETAYPFGSSPNCGDGRDGNLSSELRTDANGVASEDGSETLTLASIVSPEVALVDIVFADGSTATATPGDPTGQYDDRFWILTTTQESDDPFQGGIKIREILLRAPDGAVLGQIPVPEFWR